MDAASGPFSAAATTPSAAQQPDVFTPAPRPYLQGEFIDCDATENGTYRAPVDVKGTDLWELVRLFVLQGAVAWSVQPRIWPRVARACGALNVALHPKRTEANTAILSSLLERHDDNPNSLDIERGFFAGRYEERFQYLRSHRPGGWDPEIRIRGAEHVTEAHR